MPSLVIKHLPVELHQRLKEEAQKAHRSMTKEAIHLLEAGLLETQGAVLAQEPSPSYRVKSSPAPGKGKNGLDIPQPLKGLKPAGFKEMNRWKRDGLV
jgi:hypothetical protein